MDFDKLDKEVRRILTQKDDPQTYSEIREELIEKGYSQEELNYVLGIVDDKLPAKSISGNQQKTVTRNMLLGGILAVIALVVIGSSYLGQRVPKEIYYVSLVLFAVGYLIFRNGFRNRAGKDANS